MVSENTFPSILDITDTFDDDIVDAYNQAKQGDIEAQCRLGTLLFYKNKKEKTYLDALIILTIAANNGNKYAQQCVGYIYCNCLCVDNENVPVVNDYPKINYVNQNESQDLASDWFKQASESGEPEAQRLLIELILRNKTKNYTDKDAYRLIEDCADQGDPAQFMLWSECCRKGIGTEPSEDKAHGQYSALMEKSTAQDKREIGNFYLQDCVEQANLEKAEYWFCLSIQGGDEESLDCLGRIYASKKVQNKGLIDAIILYNQASRNNSKIAENNLNKLRDEGYDVDHIWRRLEKPDDELVSLLDKREYQKALKYCESNLDGRPEYAIYAGWICNNLLYAYNNAQQYYKMIKNRDFAIEEAECLIEGKETFELKRNVKKKRIEKQDSNNNSWQEPEYGITQYKKSGHMYWYKK